MLLRPLSYYLNNVDEWHYLLQNNIIITGNIEWLEWIDDLECLEYLDDYEEFNN